MRTTAAAAFFLCVLGATLLRASDDPASAFPDRSKAFAGVPFGAGLEQARQQWQLEEAEGASVPDDPVKVYLREEESHVFGGVRVREVIYYFLRDRFYAVGFATPDTRQTAILCEALELGYGAKPHADESGRSFVWPGSSVSAHLVVDGATGEGRLLFFSNELQPEYEQTLREAAAKTAAGFSGAPTPPAEPGM